MNRLKVLVCAYACSPFKGSEPGMGWQFVREIAKRHDVWVITEEEKFRDDVMRGLNEHPELAASCHFHFVKKRRGRLLRKLWPPSYYWFYRRWHHDAYVLASRLHEEIGFDLVHQLNMVGFREPGYMWRLPVPFVWGPVGGMMQLPAAYLPMLGVRGALYYGARNLINWFQQRYCMRCRVAAKRAGVGLVSATEEMRKKMHAFWGTDSTVIAEVGQADMPRDASPSVREDEDPLRIAWAGLHIPRKGLPMLLNALAHCADRQNFRLDILGEGPETNRWRRLSDDLDVEPLCTWHGWQERSAALDVIARSHVFVITSVLDLTSTVTLEALSLGVPVICLDLFGFGDVVTSECGVKLAVTNPEKTALDMADALMALFSNEARRRELSAGAIRRAADYAWPRKGDALNQVYERVLGVNGNVSGASRQ